MQSPQAQKRDNTWNVVFAFIGGYAMTIYLFMRLKVGKRHFGIEGFVGLGWMLLYMMHTKCDEMIILIGFFVVGNLAHQFGHAIGKAEIVHSRYGGDPWLANLLFPFLSPTRAKQFGEPIIAFLAGCLLSHWSEGVGHYVMGGAMFLAMNHAMLRHCEQERIDDLRDGMIEQQYLMSRVRERRR
jgi:hypothetical protein